MMGFEHKTKYYFNTETSEQAFGTTPTNMFSVTRLLENKPCWKKPVGALIKKKKTLILNDLNIDKLNGHERLVALERLQALHSAGFRLYTYHNQHLIELDRAYFHSHLNTNGYPLFITSAPLPDQLALDTAAQVLQLSHDELFLLNHDELTELMEGEDEHWIDKKSFELLNLENTNISNASLNRLIKTHGAMIQYLNLTGCVNLKSAEITDEIHLNALKTLVIRSPDELRAVSNDDLLEQLLKASPHLSTLDLSGFSQFNSQIQELISQRSLEHLILSHVNFVSLKTILTHHQALKTLDLSYCYNMQCDLPYSLNFKSLESLNLQRSNITSEAVKKIFASVRALKSLKLPKETPDHLSALLNFDLLEEFCLESSSIKMDEFWKILSKTKKLRVLNLAYFHNKEQVASSGSLNLESLEELTLFAESLLLQDLQKMLACPKTLKKLNIQDGFKQQPNIPRLKKLPESLHLGSLEELDLNCSQFDAQELSRIITSVSQIKTLCLSSCRNFPQQLPESLRLEFLEKLDLSDSNIDLSTLAQILSKTPRLKTLSLNKCKNLHGELPKSLSLEFLERLDLSDSNIDLSTLAHLLSNNNALQSLSLNYYKNLQGELPNSLNFESLKVLTAHHSNISSHTLGQMLAQNKGIIYLDLSGCTNLDQKLLGSFDFRQLREISLDSARLHPDFINQVKASASEHLNISMEYSGHGGNSAPQDINKPRTLDADTTPNKNNTFNVSQFFYHFDKNKDPEVSSYRLETYNAIEVNPAVCDVNSAFTLKNRSTDLQLEVPKTKIESPKQWLIKQTNPIHAIHYYGEEQLFLSDKWRPIPSLSAEERLLSYHLTPAIGVEIKYSKRDNLYYIRSLTNSVNKVVLRFMIEMPEPEPTTTLPSDVQKEISICQNFQQKPLVLNKANPCGADYFEALNNQRVGACRHRSLVFKVGMDKHQKKYPTRIINNECHSFVEIYYNNRWVSCNLGGYPGDLKITPPLRTEVDDQESLIEPKIEQLFADGTTTPATFKYFKEKKLPPVRAWDAAGYMQHLLNLEGNKKLIQCHGEQDSKGFRYQLQRYCKSTGRPYFYVHAPEDLNCSGGYIKRTGDQGSLCKGPGGPLYDFLQAHADANPGPILIVNYDQFTASDMVRYNALLDEIPKADGTELPTNMKVVGLLNVDNPAAYTGADFYSRIGQEGVLTNPLRAELLTLPQFSNQVIDNAYSMSLYGGYDWEERLLGHWIMKGKELYFVEGELIRALHEGKSSIELINAPEDNLKFQCFWQNALLHGSFEYQGQTYTLPHSFQLSVRTKNEFHLSRETCSVQQNPTIPEDALILNPGSLSAFFGQYIYKNEHRSIFYEEGLFKKNEQSTISVYVSDPLSLNEWARFLDGAKERACKITLTLAPHLTLPKELGLSQSSMAAIEEPNMWNSTTISHTAYVYSTDIDATLTAFHDSNTLIIDVSEVNPADLFLKLDAHFDERDSSFYFTEHTGALLEAINDNQKVILKGEIGDELRYALTALLLQRQRTNSPQGQLLIVSATAHLFPSIVPAYHHQQGKSIKV